VRVDADEVVEGSSKRTVFCGRFALVAFCCGVANPVTVIAPAAGLPNETLPKPSGFTAAEVVVAVLQRKKK